MNAIPIEFPTDWTQYELLDSGEGQKLERFAGYTVSRPDPRAIWKPSLTTGLWNNADAVFVNETEKAGHWKFRKVPPADWQIRYQQLVFRLRPTDFKHLGVFPEQAVNWQWLTSVTSGKAIKVLNLFAYTGGATLAASLAGAKVTHVDSAKGAIAWAKENARLSGLAPQAVRWIEDDAYKFVLREGRRGSIYDGIIMDPPRFGRGSQGEVWKLASDLPQLLLACKSILAPKPVFFLINCYTADLSSLAVFHLLEDLMSVYGGKTTFGELALKTVGSGRLLPNGIFTRWRR